MELCLSEQPDIRRNSPQAKLGFACAALVAASLWLSVLGTVFTAGLAALWFSKTTVVLLALTTLFSARVLRWQRRWGWLDHASLQTLFTAMRRDAAISTIVHDCDAGKSAGADVAPPARTLRKRVMGALRFCLMSTHPWFIRGAACFGLGVLCFMAAESGILFVAGWLLQAAAWVHWLVAAYNTL